MITHFKSKHFIISWQVYSLELTQFEKLNKILEC